MTNVNELDVLIATPSDVKRERGTAARIVEELNALLDSHELRLRARMWECDAVPEIGARPQAILNRQIGDSCDIFVGIMWSRVGTPTGAAESGTIEEFQRAKGRFDRDPGSVQILFFFSDCQLNPAAIDVEQLAAVRRFRSEIEQLGLIAAYSSHDDFELKLRVAIYKAAIKLNARRLGGKKSQELDPATASAKNIEISNAVEESNQEVDVAVAAMNRITLSILEFMVRIKTRTRELTEIQQSPNFSIHKLRENIDSAAADLESLSSRISDEAPRQSRAFSRYFQRMSDTIILSQDLTNNEMTNSQLSQAHSLLDFLADQMRSTMLKTVEFIDSLNAWDSTNTARFNSAKRQLERQLHDFVIGIHENALLVETVRDQLYSHLHRE